jgi:hypothetical protein
MKKLILLIFIFVAPAQAQSITPSFTTGSMQSTTTTNQTITETIAHEVFGAAITTYNGENVSPSSNITDSAATWSIDTAGDPWTLEITTRSAGIVETIDIDRTIETDSIVTSLSVFSQ